MNMHSPSRTDDDEPPPPALSHLASPEARLEGHPGGRVRRFCPCGKRLSRRAPKVGGV